MNGEGIDIVLVEDNPADVELTLDALREKKIVNPIMVLRDGAEALDYLFRRGEYEHRANAKPKIILLDLKLPKVDGFEVLRQIRANRETMAIPVVVLTASREERDIFESYSLGVNSYITKPVDFDQFVTTVQQLGYYWLLMNQMPFDKGE